MLEDTTSTRLLRELLDKDDSAAWRRFTEVYRPVVMSFAKKQGLTSADAEDATQETMAEFVRSYRQGGYDPAKGKFRSWLFSIAHHRILDIKRRRNREVIIADKTDASGFLNGLASEDESQAIWDQEWQRAVLRECIALVAEKVQPVTLKAFELYVLEQWKTEEVARELGITRNAVYIAKNRVLSRIREIREQME